MALKICGKCKKGNGPRTLVCECGNSFAKKEKKSATAKIKTTKGKKEDTEPVKILTSDDGKEFLLRFARGISTAFQFKFEGDEISLVDAVTACRPQLDRASVEAYCKLSLEKLWTL